MIMRRSKHQYTVEMPGGSGWSLLASECKDLAVAMAVEAGWPDQASDEIAYTLFGGLVKRAEDGEGGRRVLEKAMVVLKRLND